MFENRLHAYLANRQAQMRYNKTAVEGGRNYIDLRLWRAPNETDVSWVGDSSRGIVGRKARAALVNDAGRVANKINQYLFKAPIARAGIDEVFADNVDGAGMSIDQFFERVSTEITACGWCWVQVDRTSANDAETLASKGSVRWQLWSALDVVDWSLADDGSIVWLLVQSELYINSDPRNPARTVKLLTCYEKRSDGVYITEEADGPVDFALRTDALLPGLKRIPFVLIGRPSANAWWFDDVENVQAQVLNLDSMHNETLMESVYPQLVIPASLANSLEVRLAEHTVDGERLVQLIRELAVGRKIPILESGEEKGVTRFISPSGDLKLLTDEATRKRALLFDVAGLALFNKESRQIQTAESKAFDQLDTNSTLANRALFLQAAERKIIAMSRMFDETFPEYTPAYNTNFDVVDIAALGKALTEAANQPDITPTTRRIIALANLRLLREACGGIASEELFTAATAEIEEAEFTPTPLPAIGELL